MSHRHRFAASAAAIAIAISAPVAAIAQEQTYTFDIPAQDLAPALRAFAKTSRQQISFNGEMVRGRRSNALVGSYTASAGLEILLRDSGFTVRKADRGVLILVPVAQGGGFHPSREVHVAGLDKETSDDDNQTILVTGSHIRGVKTAVGGQVIKIGKEDIERAGHASIRDVFEALPQNLGSGATPEYQPNNENTANVAMGTTINLRGLGSTATLVLINGRRLPAGGYFADTVDASILPIGAIERIEILPDGASAVYGSDAVAGVVNFILKKDYEGFETKLRFGTSPGVDFSEYQISQTGGLNWSTGNVLLAYEFHHRDPLSADEYFYTRTADFRRQGGRDRRLPFGNPGNIIDPITFELLYAIPRNQDGTTLTPGQLLPPSEADIDALSVNRDLFPKIDNHRGYLAINQEISSAVELFSEVRINHRDYVQRTDSNIGIITVTPASPFYIDVFGTGENVSIGYSLEEWGAITGRGQSTSYGAVTGLNIRHPFGWHTQAFASFNRENVENEVGGFVDFFTITDVINSPDAETAFNPFDTVTPLSGRNIDRFVDEPSALIVDTAIDQYQIVTSGPLFSIGARDVRVAAGFDHRREHFEREYLSDPVPPGDFRRTVNALFGELHIPIVDQGMNLPGVHNLELSASLRHERYKDRSTLPSRQEKPTQSSTNPRLGLLWAPLGGLNLRASYGTSFRTPGLRTLAETNRVSAASFPDPQSPTGTTYTLLVNGAAPLTNETARTWTIGFETEPAVLRGFRFSANYFDLKFSDQIIRPNAFTALADPVLASIVIRNPSIAQVEEACALAPPSQRRNCEDPSVIRALVDGRLRNFASSIVRGVDFSASYAFDTDSIGSFTLGINGVFLADYEFSVAGGDRTSRLDRAGYPLDLRARGSMVWTPTDRTSVALFANYTDQYYDSINMRPIKSNTVFDLTATHRFGSDDGNGLLNGFGAQLAVQNLFNKAPPFYENEPARMSYDPANAEPLGRMISLTLTKSW